MGSIDKDRPPIIDRETVDMLREMDEVTDDENLILELVDEYLTHSALLVSEITTLIKQRSLPELAAKAHSLKGASLNIGALALFEVCDQLELAIRSQQSVDSYLYLTALETAFAETSDRLVELRNRSRRGENIDDLLG